MDKQGFSLVEVLFSIGALGFGVALVSAGTNLSISQGKAAVTTSQFQATTEDFKNSNLACETLIGQNINSLNTEKIAAQFSSFSNVDVSYKSAQISTMPNGLAYHDLELSVQAGPDLSSIHNRKIYAKTDGTIEECSSNTYNIVINNAWNQAGLDVKLSDPWTKTYAALNIQMCEQLLEGICDETKGFLEVAVAHEKAKDKLNPTLPGSGQPPSVKPPGTALPPGTIVSSPYGPAVTSPKGKPTDNQDSFDGKQIATGLPPADDTAFGGGGSVGVPKPGR